MSQSREKLYKEKHRKEMSTPALAQMLSIILYKKRMFPYYVWNILGGLDAEGRCFHCQQEANFFIKKSDTSGKGAVFSYDPVGSYEREVFKCGGSASKLMPSYLDNQVILSLFVQIRKN